MDDLPYYLHIDHIFDIKKEDILKVNYKDMFQCDDQDQNNLFIKKSFDRSYLDEKFLNDLETLFEEKVLKVNLWFWGASKSNMAHIDCGPDINEKHPFAINYVLNDEPSSVHWYNTGVDKNLSIKHGSEAVEGLTIKNVTTYIPVDVTDLEPNKQWAAKELTLINTSIPHIIRTDFYRVSVSIQFPSTFTLDSALKKLKIE